MAAQTQIGIRLPEDMLAAIDAYAAKTSRTTRMNIDRSSAIRVLLSYGLEAVGSNSQLDNGGEGR